MKKDKIKIYLLCIMLILIVVTVGSIYGIQGNFISEDKIYFDLQKQIKASFGDTHQEFKDFDLRIEKYEDVYNKRFVLYSFYNPNIHQRHCGYAEYTLREEKRYKRTNFGWDSSHWSMQHLSVTIDGVQRAYLMVYGMNPSGEKQLYKMTKGDQVRIEEFSGDYFLKGYEQEEGQGMSFEGVDGL